MIARDGDEVTSGSNVGVAQKSDTKTLGHERSLGCLIGLALMLCSATAMLVIIIVALRIWLW